MIVNGSDEIRPRHRDEQQDQDPGHRRPLLGHGEADSWLVRLRNCAGCPPRRAICTETCSGMLGAIRTKQVCKGQEAGQDDEAEVKEARAEHRS